MRKYLVFLKDSNMTGSPSHINPVNKNINNGIREVRASNSVINRYIKLTSLSRNILVPILSMGILTGGQNVFDVVIASMIIFKI